jgi:hypothetical protein
MKLRGTPLRVKSDPVFPILHARGGAQGGQSGKTVPDETWTNENSRKLGKQEINEDRDREAIKRLSRIGR